MNLRWTRFLTPRRPTTGIIAMVALLGASALFVTGMGIAASSQQPDTPTAGTPAASGLPIVPAAAECTVAPVALADLAAIPPASPAATPPMPMAPTGATPATPRQSAAVLATLRLQIACVNAGDIPRALALTGGAYRARLFAATGPPTEAGFAVLATPLPRVDETVIAITALDTVAGYPDGTLSARVTTMTTATTVNAVTLSPSPASPTGYVITDQQQVSRVAPTRTPIA